jgi:hypothetical protein
LLFFLNKNIYYIESNKENLRERVEKTVIFRQKAKKMQKNQKNVKKLLT